MEPTPLLDLDVPPTAASQLFRGSGEMATRCRDFDWGATPLGPVEGWSQALRTAASIVVNSRNPMFLWWGPELIQVYNDAYRPSFGDVGRHPEALGMAGRACWTDIWETIGPQIEQVMTTGESTWHEDQYIPILRNGRLDDVWWTYGYSPVFDDDGSIGGTLVTCMEVTARMQATAAHLVTVEALRESEARYRMLFDSLDEGFCVIEMLYDDADRPVDYRFLEANPAFVSQTGLADAIGRTIREMVAGHEQHWFDIYGRVARTGEPTRFQAAADAMGRHYDVFAFRPAGSSPAVVAVLFKDVTQAHAAAREREVLLEELEVERARLAAVFRVAPTFLAVLRGRDHVFELVNDAYLAMVGQRDIVGKPVLEAMPEIRGQPFLALLDGVLASGEPFVGREMRIQLQRTPGASPEARFVDFVYQPLIDARGEVEGIVAHGTDVTEQVLARRQVERLLVASEQARAEAEAARAEAEAANRAKSDFLAVMSHELRTPLNAIGGYAELMEMGIRGPVSHAMRDDLRRIQASQRHLLGLINEVLNYAKLETGTVHYDMVELRVREALSSAESLVAPQARARGLALTVEEPPPEVVARADSEKLRQVLVNLLSNAVKFTDRGGEIALWCETDEAVVRVRVRDTGLGIPAEKLEAIFEPFVQVRADLTRPHEGTGLGLAISRDLARGMGGDLEVASEPGVGSTFTLTLPRVTDSSVRT
jgi:signal transduction histidine kinase